MTYREAEPTDKVATPSASSVRWIYEPEKLFIEAMTWFSARAELCRIYSELDPMDMGDTLRLCTEEDVKLYGHLYQNRHLLSPKVRTVHIPRVRLLPKATPKKKAKKKR
mgnify:CR=1 FL=1